MTLFDPDTHLQRPPPEAEPDDDALLERWLSQSALPARAHRPPSLPPRHTDDAEPPAPLGDDVADSWFK
jgi:hypothetical protein